MRPALALLAALCALTLVAVQTNKGLLFTIDPATGVAHTIALGGESVPNGDGILLDGKTLYVVQNQLNLVAVQSNNGKLFRIDAATGAVREITLAGGESVPNGDGILLTGKRLYVVQNTDNRVAVIALAPNFASGRVVTRLSDPDFRVPTTIDDHGRRLYAVNAKFGVAGPGTAPYEVVQLAKPKGRG